jgi:hypothetical protein
MTEHDRAKQAHDTLEELRGMSEKLANIAQRNAAHVELWELGQKEGNGIEEANQREIIHNLLDQSLDTRAEALQLVKKFQSL